jgi:hypothetical protein
MTVKRLTDLTAAVALTGDELVEVSQLSSAVTITAVTISALASDNSFNDSANGFVAAGFAVNDRVHVVGFTGNVVNNLFVGAITALTTGKMTIGGTDGDVIVDDAAGESVTITKWTTKRTTAQEIADLGGGGGGSGKWFRTFRPVDNEPPAANYATLDTRNSRSVLEFDAATQEGAVFSGVMGAGYAAGNITVDIFIAADTATTGNFIFDAAFERTDVSSLDIDADSFATAKVFATTAAPGTSGQVVKVSVNFTQAEADGLDAGELFRLRIRRVAADASDTMAGDAQLLAVHVREA